jgi:hypothetical protein
MMSPALWSDYILRPCAQCHQLAHHDRHADRCRACQMRACQDPTCRLHDKPEARRP